MIYVLAREIPEGVLVFHTLTRELALLSREEYDRPEEVPALRDRWFRVPRELTDKNHTDRVRFVLRNLQKPPEAITSYSIFTTTDCNARCFYCFEMGRSRKAMDRDTARKAADYIARHCGGKRVRLGWFGGEPLYNREVIDLICRELTDRGVDYYSTMMSNGYLFDEETVGRVAGPWYLRQVQITLDGTEEVYNRCKAYIYREGESPYRVVMGNMERLLRAGIRVTVRLNMDKHNAEDLRDLVEELHERFGEYRNFSVYSHLLFEVAAGKTHLRAAEDRKALAARQDRLYETMKAYGIAAKQVLSHRLRLNQCMADSGSCRTILPGGELGVCDHYSEDNFVGHLDREEPDQEMVRSFREYREPGPECGGCFYYPDCMRLKKCEPFSGCYPETREQIRKRTLDDMENTFEAWRKHQAAEEENELELC